MGPWFASEAAQLIQTLLINAMGARGPSVFGQDDAIDREASLWISAGGAGACFYINSDCAGFTSSCAR